MTERLQRGGRVGAWLPKDDSDAAWAAVHSLIRLTSERRLAPLEPPHDAEQRDAKRVTDDAQFE